MLNVCDCCGRMARGYWFRLRLDPRYPEYAACSMGCLDAIASSAMENNGVMSKTIMERTAITEARLGLYQGLVKIGRDNAFETASKADMETVIEMVWDAIRASMHRQSAAGEVPF